MMIGGQALAIWVKSWGMYRWAGKASIQVKEVEVSSNNSSEAESKAFLVYHNIALQNM